MVHNRAKYRTKTLYSYYSNFDTMATITFLYRSAKETGNLSIRLIQGTEIDLRVSTKIQSKKLYWFKRTTIKGKTKLKHLRVENISNTHLGATKHKEFLKEVKKEITNKLLIDYNNGKPINKEWLKGATLDVTKILDTTDKITTEANNIINKEEAIRLEDERIKTANLLTSAVENMFIKYATNPNELKKYKVTHNLLLKYQKKKKKKFTIFDLGSKFAQSFINWCILEMEYQKSYTNSQLKRLRKSAVDTYEADDEYIIKVSKTLRSFDLCKDVYKGKIVITLDYNELDKIDDQNIKGVKLMDAKRALLIGCETGLRYSDMNQLIDENIKEVKGVKYWKFKAKKTDAVVQITISKRITYLIDKYGLPTTNYPDNGVKLNLNIKEVCRLSGIDEKVKGSKTIVKIIDGEKVNRKQTDLHEKHKLITSRTFRRSFATNYYGKIDTSLITAITGHSTENQLRAYISNNDVTNIGRTKEQIDKFHELREHEKQQAKENPTMRVIKNASNQ
ncbi:hypothetical protein RRF68_11200 [Tenacibaculum sp. HL-MS23]|uniref:hypothetical protein n=1 Tax=Tenacibaculum sp. HL-MS23 TaxID=3077734 RepID=UPI0028FC2EC2|nr:hypothetical protein [Tenacibaculum sp. HL-MS23]WNW01549.1 hypothetical protein RRF68_11200 [Tenacibaculum sp. HL-MS23]